MAARGSALAGRDRPGEPPPLDRWGYVNVPVGDTVLADVADVAPPRSSWRPHPIATVPAVLLLLTALAFAAASWSRGEHRALRHAHLGGPLEVKAADARHGANSSATNYSLFCFSYVEPSHQERQLLAMQLKDKVSIFACDGHAVYSGERFLVGHGLHSTAVGSTEHSEFHSKGAAALARRMGPIAAAWRRLLDDGHFQNHRWTVKAEPDAVFMPSRLRKILARLSGDDAERPEGIYLNNCELGLRRSLQVLSRNAVRIMGMGLEKCGTTDQLSQVCPGGLCASGEDKFFDSCLNDVLKIKRVNEFSVVADEQCLPPTGWWSCEDETRAGFYPFRTVDDYHHCLESALAPGGSPGQVFPSPGGYVAAPTPPPPPPPPTTPVLLTAPPITTVTTTFTETTTVTTTSTHTTTTHTTTTVLTNTTTSTWTTTSTTRDPYSLFCFSIMMPKGFELSLLRSQLARGASIFSCDAYAVYSSEPIWLSPGPPNKVDATEIGINFYHQESVPGAMTATWLNTQNFMKAWDAVIKDGRFWMQSWAVKVDPDAVFFPARLQSHLRQLDTRGEAVYIKNCKLSFGFFGALEVVSRKAVGAYSWGKKRCLNELNWKVMGEDMYMKKCFDMIGVREVTDYGVLGDGYCEAPPSPCDSGRAAFHPLKSPEQYFRCMDEAEASPPDEPRTGIVLKQ